MNSDSDESALRRLNVSKVLNGTPKYIDKSKLNVNSSVAEMTLQVTYSHHHQMQLPAAETCLWVDYDLRNKTIKQA